MTALSSNRPHRFQWHRQDHDQQDSRRSSRLGRNRPRCRTGIRVRKDNPEIFAQDGEAAFRASERAQLAKALATDGVIISTGGGAPAFEEAWDPSLLGDPQTLTVTLDARSETIHARLTAQQIREGNAVARPMLAGDDPISPHRGAANIAPALLRSIGDNAAGRSAFGDRRGACDPLAATK